MEIVISIVLLIVAGMIAILSVLTSIKGLPEVSGTWGRIQNQPSSWISVNPKYTGVIRI